MKRKALIIGNTRGNLGQSEDILAYKKFLHSEEGGAWEESEGEVKVLRNPSKAEVISLIRQYKNERLDFFMFIFTGHGGFCRLQNDTLIELSGSGVDEIYESAILNVAPKQLNILDCCRSFCNESMEKTATILANRQVMHMASATRQHARKVYDALVERSCPAQISLYACAVGQSARGYAGRGGVFSNALLDLSRFSASEGVYTVEEAFGQAKQAVLNNPREEQIPTARLPRCLANQRLPWAIHAGKWTFRQ